MIKYKLLNYFTLFILVFFSINLSTFYFTIKDKTPSFDEINIKIATQKSFMDIWFGRDTISFIEFTKIGIKKIKNEVVAETSINKENDSFYLRNHHGVLSLQLNKIFNNKEIFGINKQNLLIFFLLILSFFIILGKKEFNFFYYLNTIILFISTPIFLHSFLGPTHHLLLGLSLIVMSISLINYELTNKKKYIYLLIIGFVLSILSLETSIIFVFLFTVYFFLNFRKNLKYKDLIRFIFFFLLSLGLMYPGFFYGLDIVKSILMLTYRIFIDNSLNTGFGGSKQLIIQIFKENLIFCIYALLLTILYLKNIRHQKIYFFLLSGTFYIILFARSLYDQVYIFPGIILILLSFTVLIKEIRLKLNNIFIFSLILIFSLAQLNFYFSNQKIKKNYNIFMQKVSGHAYSDNFKADIDIIDKYLQKKKEDFYITKKSEKLKIYSDFPKLFWLYNERYADIIQESYIDNNEIIIKKNYDQLKLFKELSYKNEEKLIFIFQRRLVSSSISSSLLQLGFIEKELNTSNFIIFQKR